MKRVILAVLALCAAVPLEGCPSASQTAGTIVLNADKAGVVAVGSFHAYQLVVLAGLRAHAYPAALAQKLIVLNDQGQRFENDYHATRSGAAIIGLTSTVASLAALGVRP